MHLHSDIRSISYVKSNAAEMLRQVNETHRPIVITQNGEAAAVLMDPDSYQDLHNALAMLKLVSQSEQDHQEDRVYSHEDVISRVRARVRAKS